MDVLNNAPAHRFEVRIGDAIATLDYALRDGRITLIHTEVPKTLAGHGVGSALARGALEYARHEGLRVVPRCPFVRTYLARHPEYQALSVVRDA